MLVLSSLLSRLPLARLVARAARRVAKVQRAISNRIAVRKLQHFDDHALKDIGLTRSEVTGALQVPIWQDPSLALAEHAGQEAGHAARARRLGVRRPMVNVRATSAVNA